MALFSVFSYKRRPPPSIPAVMDALEAAAHIEATRVTRRQLVFANGSIYVHALATPTAMYDDTDQVHTGRDLVAINGFAFQPGAAAPSPLTASDIASDFKVETADGFAGDFALCHVARNGTVTALSDLHRVQNLFWIDTPWVFGVSTRPSLLRLLAGDPGFDSEAVAAISAIGYSLGDATAHAGVRAIPQGTALQWDRRTVKFLERDRVILHPREGGLDVDDAWTQRQLDDGIQESAQSIELAAGPSEHINLGITGGKDSRLILAFCLAQGLKPRLRLFTRGPAHHPDVVVGRVLAERVGVPHRTIEHPEPAANALEAQGYLRRLATAAFQTDGLAGGWDPFTAARCGKSVGMAGHMGGVLKSFAKTSFDPERRLGADQVVALQSPFDPLGVLKPDARALMVDGLEQRFTQLLDAGFELADLPDVFYYENRIPNWLGNSKQVHTFAQTGVAPLGAVPLARLAFRASAAQRKAELIHYLLMRRAAPELLDVPFAMQTWSPDLPGAPVLDPVPLPVTDTPVPRHGSWQYAANTVPEFRAALRQVVADAEHPVLWEALDRDTLLARLDEGPLAMKSLISLLGIVSMAMFLDGRVETAKLPAPGTTQLCTTYEFRPAEPGPVGWRPC